MIRRFLKKIVDSLIAWECRLRKTGLKPKTLLVFRKDGLGDFLLWYPLWAYYRRHFADWKITLVLPSIVKDLSPLVSSADEIIYYEPGSFRRSYFARRSFIKKLALFGFETAIYPSFTREEIGDLIISLTNARDRIGWKSGGEDWPYTRLIDLPDRSMTELKRNTFFIEQITGRSIPEPVFPTIDLDLLPPAALSIPDSPYAVIFPGTKEDFKKWPAERYGEVADYIVNEYGLMPVTAGNATDDKQASRVIAASMEKSESVIDLAGQTDLVSLARLLANARFYVGNDTGAAHLAVALGIPAIVIMGGGHFGRFFPYGDPAKNIAVFDPEMKCKYDNWKCAQGLPLGTPAPCIAGVQVEQVKSAIDKILNEQ